MQTSEELTKTLFSLGLTRILESLGYSSQMVSFRRMLYRKEDFVHEHFFYQYHLACLFRLVGSKAEGCSRLFESDFDYLVFSKYVVCIEASIGNYTESISNLNSVYTMIPCLYHPGHFKLLLTSEGLTSPVSQTLRTCLIPKGFGHWLSSKEYLEWAKYGFETGTTAGPAACLTHSEISEDNTLTLTCICPTILGNWVQRNRKYNWPPSEVIQQISKMNGNLVATGIKGCYEEEIEWRLCFNEIEILLIENWNEIGTKLYIFLKIIKKDILKLDNEITSYIMKNIVFWLSENYPQTEFRPDNLFSWAIKALRLLKRAVKVFHLPYYMIPERNLIAEKLQRYRRKDVIKQINSVINLGPQLLWHSKKIEMAMTMSLSELQLYQNKKDELERLMLVELLHSPWPPVVQQQLNKCSACRDMFLLLLK